MKDTENKTSHPSNLWQPPLQFLSTYPCALLFSFHCVIPLSHPSGTEHPSIHASSACCGTSDWRNTVHARGSSPLASNAAAVPRTLAARCAAGRGIVSACSSTTQNSRLRRPGGLRWQVMATWVRVWCEVGTSFVRGGCVQGGKRQGEYEVSTKFANKGVRQSDNRMVAHCATTRERVGTIEGVEGCARLARRMTG
jgi:hypothetical protein